MCAAHEARSAATWSRIHVPPHGAGTPPLFHSLKRRKARSWASQLTVNPYRTRRRRWFPPCSSHHSIELPAGSRVLNRRAPCEAPPAALPRVPQVRVPRAAPRPAGPAASAVDEQRAGKGSGCLPRGRARGPRAPAAAGAGSARSWTQAASSKARPRPTNWTRCPSAKRCSLRGGS